jgi:hypothetical protein
MTLTYSTHSRFFAAIEAALRKAGGSFQRPIRVYLGPKGYKRDAIVRISRSDSQFFETDWESNQPSRFSARVRAAATVLQREGYRGRFRISHSDGTLVITSA